ncbi:hypothetical protein DFH11DRAFT_1622812 [Phellopilus nigrolimitatus]|nr:hypothetical protein DFH11DRAFT_1622812 [Phellopilus nigrolimitatus]
MGVAGDYARRALRARVSRNDAVAIYAIACRFKLEEEARLAARAFLQGPRDHSLVPQMDGLSSTAYYHLLSYHTRFADTLPLLLTSVEYAINVLMPVMGHHCTEKPGPPGSIGDRKTYEWWFYAREAIIVELRNAPLAADSFASSTVAPCIKKTNCGICKTNALPNWDTLKRLTLTFLSDEANKTELILPWK